MTLPITIPSSPSTGSSSDGGDPRTPVSPVAGQQTLPNSENGNGNSSNPNSSATGKRKASRRANTAERRATHNAVERARRETLNGRFLDLAKLLPNLSQIRRPSKSAIVNSSIAHVHASRRHRALAARELRVVKLEADNLRRELNEWRDRAGIPRIEEPVRGEGFGMVLNQELEVIPIGAADEEDGDEYGMYDDGTPVDDNEFGAITVEEQQRIVAAQQQQAQVFRPQVSVSTYPAPPQPQRSQSFHGHSHGPMIASPTAVSFENPALGVYDSHVTVPGNPYPDSAAFVQEKFSGGMPQIPPQVPFAGYPGRGRSASVTSSGSASPPHMQMPVHRSFAGQGQCFEPGWGGLGMPMQMMQRGQNIQMGGGMGNPGVAFAMMM